MPGVDLDLIESWAREAGEILVARCGNLDRVEKKGARDLVTVADQESEELIISRIRAAYPDDAILAEETRSSQREAPRLWIVDPLDGTTNFVHRIPHFAVSIALYEDGAPTQACVYNPALDECYRASRGGGAFKNAAPIHCSGETTLSESVLASGFHYGREFHADSNLQHFVDLAYRARGLRRLGSAALDLCYLAEGRFDGFWELHLAPWDVAAGALIALEAGCTVTDLQGGAGWLFGGEIVAASSELSVTIREVLAAADPDLLPGPRFGEG